MNKSTPLLSIDNLYVEASNKKPILQGLNLSLGTGEVHAVMGPNGSGKSTLGYVLAGREEYTVQSGKVAYKGQDLLALSPEERAAAGLFLGFQYPVAIPGVNNMYFLRTALNSLRKQRGEAEVDAMAFLDLARAKLKDLGLGEHFLYRSVNDAFSGGEKKRNEILQLLLLEPKLAILDEADSGLDIDALQMVAEAINTFRNANRTVILVTHYQRLLNYVVPDYVHVLMQGRIVQSGDHRLALTLEEKGYQWLQSHDTDSVESDGD